MRENTVAFETNVRKNQKDIRSGSHPDPYLLFQVRNYTEDIYNDPNWIEQKKLMDVNYENQRVRNLDTTLYRFGSKHYVNQDLIFNPDTKVAYNKGVNPYNVVKPNVPVPGVKLYFPDSVLPTNNYNSFNRDNPHFELGQGVEKTTYTGPERKLTKLPNLFSAVGQSRMTKVL